MAEYETKPNIVEKLNDGVEDFQQLDTVANKRVREALHSAIERELKSDDHTATSIFGQGSAM